MRAGKWGASGAGGQLFLAGQAEKRQELGAGPSDTVFWEGSRIREGMVGLRTRLLKRFGRTFLLGDGVAETLGDVSAESSPVKCA